MISFIDTHTHLYLDAFDIDRTEAISRAKQVGVERLLLPDIDSSHRSKLLFLAEENPGVCFPMLGIHPTSIKENYQQELSLLNESLENHKVYAIGECGLDYYWDKTYIEQQKIVLIEQFYLAHHYKLPLVLHSRKSLNDLILLLKQYKHLSLTGVFHCFPGNEIEALKVIELGFYLGIGGVVTYKNATMASVVKNIDLDYILLETDAPFLPPIPYRGKRNESAYITVIAETIARIKNTSVEEIAIRTTKNAEKLFEI